MINDDETINKGLLNLVPRASVRGFSLVSIYQTDIT
jgi:hypothetical protein